MLVPESVNEAIKHLSPKSSDEILTSLANLPFDERVKAMKKYNFSNEEIKGVIERENLSLEDKIEYMYAFKYLFSDEEVQKVLASLTPEERMVVRMTKSREDIKKIIEDAYNEGIDGEKILETIEKTSKIYRHIGRDWNHDYKQAQITLKKLERKPTDVEYDDEYNTYVFIGFSEKKPVTIKGKKYYEDKLGTEGIVKIDKFNVSDLQSISMMKLRAKIQYSGEGNVYMIKVPKDFMDEDHYSEIPEGFEDLFDKYKTKI